VGPARKGKADFQEAIFGGADYQPPARSGGAFGTGEDGWGNLPADRGLGAKLRDEILNGEIFYSLKGEEEEQVVQWVHCPMNQVLIERWRRHYNSIQPHGAVGCRPPVPGSILPHTNDLPSATHGFRADPHFKHHLGSLN